jgi:hypothetical protein
MGASILGSVRNLRELKQKEIPYMINTKKVCCAVIVTMLIGIASGRAVSVEVGIDQLALTYTDTTYLNEIIGGSIRIGKLGVAENALTISDKTSFDAFLADGAKWTQYGATANYLPGNLAATYTFNNNFEPFVENYGSTTLPERPFQLYVAVTSGSNLFGLFTWRGTTGDVSRFALTADDTPVLSFANEAFDDGRLNLEAVAGYGAVRVLNGSVDSAVALVPEPSSASLLLLGSALLLGVSSIRRATSKNVQNKIS